MTDHISNCLFEALTEAELEFSKAETHEQQYAAASAWLTIADLLQERGDMDIPL